MQSAVSPPVCLHPPRSVVLDGDWYCHLCDEAFSHVEELRHTHPILFAWCGDPYHPDHAALLRSYVQLQEPAVVEYRSMLAAEDDWTWRQWHNMPTLTH